MDDLADDADKPQLIIKVGWRTSTPCVGLTQSMQCRCWMQVHHSSCTVLPSASTDFVVRAQPHGRQSAYVCLFLASCTCLHACTCPCTWRCPSAHPGHTLPCTCTQANAHMHTCPCTHAHKSMHSCHIRFHADPAHAGAQRCASSSLRTSSPTAHGYICTRYTGTCGCCGGGGACCGWWR